MTETAARAAHVEKVKTQMMQVMGITDPAEFQKMARDYCKDMAVEMSLPFYIRIFSRVAKLTEKVKEKFSQLPSKEEKICFILKAAMEDDDTVDTFNLAFNETDKDCSVLTPELSGEKRAAGNTQFQNKKDTAALALYTEAAMSADTRNGEGRKDAAMALANRSAVLFKLKRFEDCVEDIEAALFFDYPQNLRYKILERQALSLLASNKVKEAEQSFHRAILQLKQSSLDGGKQDELKKKMMGEVAKLKEMKVTDKKEEMDKVDVHKTPVITQPNANIPQFSDCVSLVHNKHVGRHGKATRDIGAGETIMVDTSITHHLLCSTRETHCSHCLKKLPVSKGFPNPEGVGMRFCRLACLKTAADTYLAVESKIDIDKYFWNRKEKRYDEMSGNVLLTYRAVTQKPLEFWEKFAEFQTVNQLWGVTEEGDKCLHSDYRNLFNLEGHRNNKSMDALLSLSIRTAMFIVLLRYGGYFGQKETPFAAVMSKKEQFLANIIYHIQEGIQYNLHSVDSVIQSKLSGIAAPQLQEVGSAVFPTLLLLNHSCEPNTLRINTNGNQVLMVAKRKIKKGEEITDNYGIHHLSMTFEERQEALQKGFSFSCCCNACSADFPRLKSLRSSLPEIVEDKFEALREDVKEKFRKEDLSDCYRLAVDMIKLLENNNVVYPHRNYELSSLCLLSCMWTLYGNKQ